MIGNLLEEGLDDDEDDEEIMQSTYSLPRPSPTHGEPKAKFVLEQSPIKESAKVVSAAATTIKLASQVHDIRESYQKPEPKPNAADFITGRHVGLLIESCWEDADFCGLNGFEVLIGPSLTRASIKGSCVSANPHGLSDIGYEDDIRTPDKLVDGVNNTTSEDHSWLFPFTRGSQHSMKVDLQSDMKIAGIRVWNYNKSQETARTRGAKHVSITVDGNVLFRCTLRMVSSPSSMYN